MNQSRQLQFEKTIRLFILLTTLELFGMGIFLIRARSLNMDTGAFGYSLPRLALLAVWLIGFGFCVWALVAAFKGSGSFQRIRLEVEKLLEFEKRYTSVWGWLIVITVICWGMVLLSLFKPDFLTFIWSSLPVLVRQYAAVIFIVGLLAVQGLIFMERMSPFHLSLHDAFGTITTQAILLFLLALFIYAYTAIDLDLATRSRTSYFPELAQSFLQGRLDLPDPPSTKDLTLFGDKFYVSFPPLGALLMIPFAALRGVESINVLLFNDFFAALGVTFTFLMLETMKNLGWNQLRWWENGLLALFLGFGTAQYYLSERTLVNLISHILATSFLALSLWLAFLGAQRQKWTDFFLAGTALGLAMLARPNVIFACVALAAILFQRLRELEKFNRINYFRQIFFLTIPIVTVILGLFWYNQARFGSPIDFGYAYMLLDQPGDLITYGQFHPHFIAENLYDNFLRLPYWETECRMFAPNPQGTSIFLTSPVIVYLARAWKREVWVLGAWISIGFIALTHALYYNSGAIQFGYRFSMDFMPMVIALLAFGFKDKLPRFALLLIVYSVLVNYVGVIWNTHKWCENF